ncbi:replication initiation protein [Marinomonas sp. 2405UD68-3]|uniref:replication initiation protein n=1 Tax=Marinomonas sp. 2405UD68-3 TaxID=3391835 RepID=UPI0039C90B27
MSKKKSLLDSIEVVSSDLFDTEAIQSMDIDNTFVQAGIIKYPEGEHEKFTVTKSNRLISAQIQLTAREQKILAACISLINPLGIYPNGITVELEDHHIEALTGIDKRHLFRFIDDAARKFHSIPIQTPGAKPGTISYINIAHKSVYDPDLRKLVVKFHEDMEDELVRLSQYTSIELRYFVRMNGKYATRLYEIISKQYNKQKGGTQFFKARLEDLYFPLGLKDIKGNPITPSYLRDFASFKIRVLDPACKDVSENSNFVVSYNTYKAGRSVVGLTFTIKPKKLKIKNDDKEFKIPLCAEHLNIDQAMQFLKIKETVYDKLKTKYDESVLKSNIFYCIEKMQDGIDIKNTAAFLTHLLRWNIANLPDVANPYSLKYKNNKNGHEFVKRVVVPIWWKLPESLRLELTEFGSFADHVLTTTIYKGFVSTAKNESFDEAEMLYDSVLALEEWGGEE